MPTIYVSFAVAAGLLAFFSACLIPIIPAYIAYISGVSLEQLKSGDGLTTIRRRVFLSSLFFVLGFSLIFVIMGASASLLGKFFISNRATLQKMSGLLMILFGLYLAGLVKIPWLYRETKIKVKKNLTPFNFLNSFLIGAAFAFGWTPCIGPILASILFLASISQTMWQGVYLLSLFSFGLAIPFLIIGATLNYGFKFLAKHSRYLGKIQLSTGIIVAAMGVLLLLGEWENLLAYFIRLFS